MKRTIKIALLTCLVLLVCVPMFTACNITDVKNYIDEIIPDRILPGETSEHVWSEWITIKEPSCEEKGLLQRYCTECSYTESKPIEALGHTEVVDNTAVLPNCTEAGLTESKLCSVCDKVLAVQTVIDALGHIEVVDSAVAPTCIKAGITEGKHCSVCNKVLVAQTIVEALGHSETIVAGVAPTCTEAGLSASKYCLVCGEVLIKQVVIEAKGHSFGEWITTKEPSAIEEGLMKRVCWCGEEETHIIEICVSIGLECTLNNDGTSYSVTGIGSCTDTDVIIPSTCDGAPVTSIGNYALNGCSGLTSITIPKSITGIGVGAFYGCIALKSIVFGGTIQQWNDITLGYRWNYNVLATEVICSDGVISLN